MGKDINKIIDDSINEIDNLFGNINKSIENISSDLGETAEGLDRINRKLDGEEVEEDDDSSEYYEYEDSMTLEMMRKVYCSPYITFYQMFLKLRPGFTPFYIEQKFNSMKKDFGSFLFSLDQELFNDIVKYLQEEHND